MRRFVVPTAVFALVAALQPLPAAAQKIVCWNDEHGRRACGDRVPPQYAKVERQVFNERGIVVDQQAREATAEERAVKEEQDRLKQEAERRKRDEAAYDRYLIESYSSLKDLEGMRDTRLAALDGRLELTHKAIAGDEASAKGLRDRIAALKASGKEPAAVLLDQLKAVESSLADSRKAADQIVAERDKIKAQFARDLARFQELQAAKAAVAAP